MSKIVKELISENKRLKHELCLAACELRNLKSEYEDDFWDLKNKYESVCNQFLKEVKSGIVQNNKMGIDEADLITDEYDKTTIRKYKETFHPSLSDYIIEEEIESDDEQYPDIDV